MELNYSYLDQIENLSGSSLSPENYERLIDLTQHPDSSIRFRVAEILVSFPSLQTDYILASLLNDKDELVRVTACDSLCISESKEIKNLLKTKAIMDSPLVKRYAILSLADITMNLKDEMIHEEIAEFIKNFLSKEEISEIRLSGYHSLCVLGLSEYYSKILEFLDDPTYQNRCAAINSIKELISDENKKQTIDRLKKRAKIEKIRAVKCGIDSLLSAHSS